MKKTNTNEGSIQRKEQQQNATAPVATLVRSGVSATPPPLSNPVQTKKNTTGLPESLQAKMEGAFNSDFSNVNVHQNSPKADAIGAKAYTQGNDVHFAPGSFNPESRGGQELIGHELNHVVQQRQGRVQPTVQAKGLPINNSQSLEHEADKQGAAAANGQRVLNGPTGNAPANFSNTIQRKATKAYTLHKTRIKPDKNSMPSRFARGTAIGAHEPIEVEDDAAKVKNGYVPITAPAGKSGWIKKNMIAFAEGAKTDIDKASKETPDADDSADDLGTSGEFFSNSSDTLSESGDAYGDNVKAVDATDKAYSSVATLNGILGMAVSIKSLAGPGQPIDKALGVFDLLASTNTAVKGVSGITKAISDAKGSGGHAEKAGKTFAAAGIIDGAIGSIKGVVVGIKKAYDTYKHASTAKEKATGSLEVFQNFAGAVKSAAEAAKGVYEILNKAVPPHLQTAIPALSIVFTAIGMIMHLVDAISNTGTRKDMSTEAEERRGEFAGKFAVPPDDITELFRKDKRGTFPAYKYFYRTKPEVKAAVHGAHGATDPAADDATNKSNVENFTKQSSVTAGAKIKAGLNETGKADGHKQLGQLVRLMQRYEYADKMAEINMKRETGSWTNVVADIINITADILTLTGVGASVGAGIKTGVAAYKTTHSISKAIQKGYRNKKKTEKSSENKHNEYVEHTKFIFKEIGSLDPANPAKADVDRCMKYLKATGVSTTQLFAEKNAKEMFMMVVNAMKAR